MQLRDIQDQCVEDSEKYFPGAQTFHATEYWLLALGGEVGELQNVLKKRLRGDLTEQEWIEAAASELPDILIYLLTIASWLGVDMEIAYRNKREFNNARYLSAE